MYRWRSRRLAAILVSTLILNIAALSPAGAGGERRAELPIADPPTSLPQPPERGPNGEKPVIPEELRNVPPPAEPNRVKALSRAAVDALEARGHTIVENHDGLVAADVTDPETGARTRVAAINGISDGGIEVIGLVFLDEEEIAQLEARQARGAASPLFGPGLARAHFKDQSHYHYFWDCSWVFNQGGTYAITIHFCPNNFSDIKFGGMAVAAALGISTGHPWLGWITGVAWNYGTNFCRTSSGACQISISDFRAYFGWANYHHTWTCTPCNIWFYFYSSSSAYYRYAYRDDTGGLYYIAMSGV